MPRWPKKENAAPVPVLGSDDKKPKQPARSHHAKKRVTQDMVRGLVALVNLPVGAFAPDYALTEVEGAALVVAITDLAATNPYVNNLIIKLVTASSLGEVPIVVSAIAMNKLAVAGKIPQGLADQTNGLLGVYASRMGVEDVEARGARRSNRQDRERQDNAGEGATPGEGLRDSDHNETRPLDLADKLAQGDEST